LHLQKRSFQEDEISSADDVDSDSEDVDNNNDDIDNNNDCKTGDASVNTACCRFQLTNDSVRLPPRGKSLNELESHNNTMVADESDSTNASVESCSDVLCDESVDMQMPDDEPLIAELVSSDDDASHGVLPVLPDNYTANMYAQHDDVSSRDSSDERVCSADDTTSTASSLPHANKDHCDDELPFTDEQAVVRKRRSRIKPATDSLRKNQQGSDKITPYSGEIAEPSETSGKCDSSVEFNNDKQLQCYPVEVFITFHYFFFT
jgi:hypothetical protein